MSGQTGTPVPRRDVEQQAVGSGPVITYKLSRDEIEALWPTKNPAARNSDGQRVKPPVARRDSFTTKGEKSMQNTAQAAPTVPSKIDFLKQIAAGKAISKIEREWNMSTGSLHYWVGKWDLKGIKPDRAQQLLDEAALDGGTVPAVAEQAAPDLDKDAEIERLRTELSKRESKIERLTSRIDSIIEDANKNARLADENLSENLRLKKQVSELTKSLEIAERAVEGLENDQVNLKSFITELETALDEANCQLALREQKAYEKATLEGTSDPVNHPAHYTAGAVECIDAIESATIGLSGGLAYNTGAAIKYLWRWSRKNGAEDLQKARWYVDRLIDAVKGAGSHEG